MWPGGFIPLKCCAASRAPLRITAGLRVPLLSGWTGSLKLTLLYPVLKWSGGGYWSPRATRSLWKGAGRRVGAVRGAESRHYHIIIIKLTMDRGGVSETLPGGAAASHQSRFAFSVNTEITCTHTDGPSTAAADMIHHYWSKAAQLLITIDQKTKWFNNRLIQMSKNEPGLKKLHSAVFA